MKTDRKRFNQGVEGSGGRGMTFEEYWGEDPDPGKITAKHAWNAAQQAERDKYAELIEAAEAVIERWETPLWKDAGPTAKVVYRMKDVIERCKNEN